MSRNPDATGLEQTLATAVRRLLEARTAQGHWVGNLSSSALSTATAAFALGLVDPSAHRSLVGRALAWLAANQNADGGWGDTPASPSNLSTSLLGWCALSCPEVGQGDLARARDRASSWVVRQVGGSAPRALAQAVNRAYGGDRTFSAPILTLCALAGRLGRDPWAHVAALPFEMGLFSHRWLRWLRLPVVSYALPALIAIGQVRHRFRPSLCPFTRAVRHLARAGTLRRLERIQPPSGGFLEAAPLSSFVAMSLAAMGRADHPVVAKAAAFLTASARADGSWPIDTNLATWVTTLSVQALAAGGRLEEYLPAGERAAVRDWLLGQQHRAEHPYTGAAPGGWAWTDLPGGVPDADDTAGALLALKHLGAECDDRVQAGIRWLLGLQNRDGGIPTFCRGWGRLPFDRSAADLTAHTLAAWGAWSRSAVLGASRSALLAASRSAPAGLAAELSRSADRARAYLRKAQQADGSWWPLWFGNQGAPEQANPAYGTARVLEAVAEELPASDSPAGGHIRSGIDWLTAAQHPDGGWGGAPGVRGSIEETAAAVAALATAARHVPRAQVSRAVHRGVRWLIDRTDAGRCTPAAPIGLYFARLWYFEELYPLVFLTSALGRASRLRQPT